MLSNWLPIMPIPIVRTTKPKNQGTIAIASPAKLRFGRPGTRTHGTIHLMYQIRTHGAGMMKIRPTTSTRVRHVNSSISKSIDSGPPL